MSIARLRHGYCEVTALGNLGKDTPLNKDPPTGAGLVLVSMQKDQRRPGTLSNGPSNKVLYLPGRIIRVRHDHLVWSSA